MLYNKAINIPANLVKQASGHFDFVFSRHSLMACLNDRYGQILPPRQIDASADNIIEIETAGQQITKIVIRTRYNQNFDLTIVFIPEQNRGFVKTVWLNSKADNHATLNRRVYA